MKTFTLIGTALFLSIGFTTSAQAAVQLEGDFRGPGLEGLVWEYSGTTEIDINAMMAPVGASMPQAAVERFLVASALPPIETTETLPDGKTKQRVLERICFSDGLSFCLSSRANATWKVETDFFGLVRDFPNGGPEYLSPVATYQVYYDGRPGLGSDQRGNVVRNQPMTVARLKNLPSTLRLRASDIESSESVLRDARDDERASQTAERLRRYCAVAANRVEGSFSAFLCERAESESFTHTLKMRLRFRDQDGVLRDFVFERSAPIRMCDFTFGDAPTCHLAGLDEASWSAWYDEASFAAASAYIANKEKLEGELVATEIESYIPASTEADPILAVARAQSRTLRIE